MKTSNVTFILIIIFFTLVGLIGSCSTILYPKPYIDSVLEPAFENWRIECVVRGIKYKREISKIDSILFVPLKDGYWGRCYGNKITINSEAISPIDEFTLKLVMFHELGHCAFDYPHYEYGVDIMNSVLPEEEIFLYQYFWGPMSDQYFDRYIPKKERRKMQKRLEKQDCFCILDEDKLQVK